MFLVGQSFSYFILIEWRSLFEFQRHFFSKLQLHIFSIVFQKALTGWSNVQDQRLNLSVILMPHVWLLKMIYKLRFSLNSSICEFTYFFTVKTFPLLSIELFKKFEDKNWVYKINKCVSNITFILQNEIRKKKFTLKSIGR